LFSQRLNLIHRFEHSLGVRCCVSIARDRPNRRPPGKGVVMNESRSAVPPPMAFPGTLRKITETLAAELACSSQRAPDWSDFEWKIARAVSAMHGVSPLLSKTLRWQGPVG
jgi:hypothetical protein